MIYRLQAGLDTYIITMKFFAFAASSIIVFAASVVVKVATDDQSNVIALLRGGGGGGGGISKSTLTTINTEAVQLGGGVVVGTSFPGQSIVCTTSIPDIACYPNTPRPGWPANVVFPLRRLPMGGLLDVELLLLICTWEFNTEQKLTRKYL